MDEIKRKVLETFCQVTNRIKRTGYSVESLTEETYLGGELGIDSIEMLEIWYDMEQALGIHIDDESKRDIYTVGETVNVVSGPMTQACAA